MFKPLHHDHAIESVIFRLTGKGEMMEHERINLQKGYQKYWQAVLPKEIKGHLMEISLGPAPLVDDRPKPLAPTKYVEFSRTGNLAWWMEIAGRTITIGCTQYAGWKNVSSKAFGLFSNFAKTLDTDHPLAQICSAELTYVDLLQWVGGKQAYKPELAIQKFRLPRTVLSSKTTPNLREWHLGEGWVDDPEAERVLERFQISSLLQPNGDQIHPIIRIETTAIWGFGTPKSRLNLNRAFDNIQEVTKNGIDGRTKYNELHARVKSLLGTLITENLANQIGLQKSGETE